MTALCDADPIAPDTPQGCGPGLRLSSGLTDPHEEEPAHLIRGIYKLPRCFLDTIWPEGLGAEGTRLLHGLLHLACREKENAQGAGDLQPGAGYRVPLSVLRDTIGPKGANDAGAIRVGVAELRETGLFEVLELQHGNRLLFWRFSGNVLDWLFADALYGLLDIYTIGLLRRPLPVTLYAWLCMFRAMRRPQFAMTVEGLWSTAARKGVPCWTRLSGSLLRDLQLVAAASEVTFVLHLNWRGRLSGIDELAVRVVHAKTQWTAKVLCKSDPGARQVVVVTSSNVHRYAPKSFTRGVAAELCRMQQGGDSLDTPPHAGPS